MTEPQDKLLGVTISGGTTKRTYSAYRIDYDSSLTLAEIAGVDDLDGHYSGQAKYIGETSINRGHYSVKDNYKRIILVSDATTRDEVQADLDSENVTYTTEDVAPTKQEKTLIEREDAQNISEVEEALTVQNDLLERKLISQTSKDTAAEAIQNVSDADAQVALEKIYEVLTGETLN